MRGLASPDGVITVEPGEFILGSTVEYLEIPTDLVGIICGKSSVARTGLTIENAGLVDPGFHGTITLEIANLGSHPVNLEAGKSVCQIYFMETSSPVTVPYGKAGNRYQGQRGPTACRPTRSNTP